MQCILPNRGVLQVSGDDRTSFLQGLVTNDVTQATGSAGIYACLLTAQGRFLHDMFILAHGDALLIDCEADRADDLLKRLKMFRLRAKVELSPSPPPGGEGRGEGQWQVTASSEAMASTICIPDPRAPELGYRIYNRHCEERSDAAIHDGRNGLPRFARNDDVGYYLPAAEYDRLRITLGVPDGSRDMLPGEALLLENNVDDLHGIAWDKGCYIGQELTARMKYKAQPKRRLAPVRIDEPLPEPGTLLYNGEREVGEMRSSCKDIGLALLRLDVDDAVTGTGTRLVRL